MTNKGGKNMKAIWSGSISFGLVSIPVDLYAATQEHVLGFKVLCQTCQNPVSYRRWCDHCKKEVAWDHVVKGLEIKKGKFLVLTPETVKKLRPEKTSTITIVEFVNVADIAPIYFEHHYYIAPDKQAQKAYALLSQALKVMGKAAIGQFVMRDKQYVCSLQNYDRGILLSTLHYAYEIRSMDRLGQLAFKQPKINAAELKLAKQLINTLTKKKFDISEFKDTFAQELKALIKKHKKGKVVEVKKKKTKKVKIAPSLIHALQESLVTARA